MMEVETKLTPSRVMRPDVDLRALVAGLSANGLAKSQK